MSILSNFSKKNLKTLHPDLQKLCNKVAESADIRIECGYRGKEAQEKAFNNGFSKAHFGQSPHNYEPALAVDILPYPQLYSSNSKFRELAGFIKITAIDLGIAVDWGGDWNSFKDYPHWQLHDWKKMI